MKVELKKNLLTPGTVTVPNSKERVEALAKAKSHGARFLITGNTCVQVIPSRHQN